MRLEDVLPAYRAGKKIKRESWGKSCDLGVVDVLHASDFNASDWLIIDDPITITREQFERAWKLMKDSPEYWVARDFWEELSK